MEIIWLTIINTIIAVAGVVLAMKKNRSDDIKSRHDKGLALTSVLWDLETMFRRDFGNTYQRLINENDVLSHERNERLSPEDTWRVESYMNFFAQFRIVVSSNLITMDELDRYFAYRFFVAAHNPRVREVIMNKKEHFSDLFFVYDTWTTYRKKHNLKTIGQESEWNTEKSSVI